MIDGAGRSSDITVGVWCNRTLSSNSQLLLSRTPSQICSLTLSKNTAVTHVQAEPYPLYGDALTHEEAHYTVEAHYTWKTPPESS